MIFYIFSGSQTLKKQTNTNTKKTPGNFFQKFYKSLIPLVKEV